MLQKLVAATATKVPPSRARAVFSLRLDADDLLAGSFWSPAFRTSKVRWLQLGGISLRGGGSLAICNQGDAVLKLDVCKATGSGLNARLH